MRILHRSFDYPRLVLVLVATLAVLTTSCGGILLGPESQSGGDTVDTAQSTEFDGEGTVTGFGVEGTVTLTPSCPVEGPGLDCDPIPAIAEITANRSDDGSSVATAASDANGRFQISLPAGSYRLQAVAEGAMFCKPVDAVVEDGYTVVDIACDTGIRQP